MMNQKIHYQIVISPAGALDIDMTEALRQQELQQRTQVYVQCLDI